MQPDVKPATAYWFPSTRRLIALAGLTSLVGVMVAVWDVPLSSFLRFGDLPGDVRKTIALSETFGHFSGALIVLSILIYIDDKNRRRLVAGLAFTAVSGLFANSAKWFFDRLRPHVIDRVLAGDYDLPPELEGRVPLDGWIGVLGFTESSASFWDATHRSFPSGHAAVAIALAIALSIAYPKGRFIFSAIGILACYQRVYSGAHFLSDVFAGATIALAVAAISSWLMRLRSQTGPSASESRE
jgi:membrane-associated phospholipid phosphatase